MAMKICDAPLGCKYVDDKLLIRCNPYERCSVKIGVLEGGDVIFYRYANRDEVLAFE